MPINHTPLLNSTERVIPADSVTTLDGKRRHYRVITARQLDSHPPCARRSCSYYSSTDDVRIDRKGNKMDENFVRNIPRNEGGEFCCKACRVNGGFGGHSVLCHKIEVEGKAKNSGVGGAEPAEVWHNATRAAFFKRISGPFRHFKNGQIAVAVQPLKPFVATVVQLRWSAKQIQPNADGENLRAQLVGKPLSSFAPTKKRSLFKFGWASAAQGNIDDLSIETVREKNEQPTEPWFVPDDDSTLIAPQSVSFIQAPPRHCRYTDNGDILVLGSGRTETRLYANDVLFSGNGCHAGLPSVTKLGSRDALLLTVSALHPYAIEYVYEEPMLFTGIKTNSTSPFTLEIGFQVDHAFVQQHLDGILSAYEQELITKEDFDEVADKFRSTTTFYRCEDDMLYETWAMLKESRRKNTGTDADTGGGAGARARGAKAKNRV